PAYSPPARDRRPATAGRRPRAPSRLPCAARNPTCDWSLPPSRVPLVDAPACPCPRARPRPGIKGCVIAGARQSCKRDSRRGCPCRFWLPEAVTLVGLAHSTPEARMPTLTIEYATEAERLALEQ